MGVIYAVKGINTIHAFYGINAQYAFSCSQNQQFLRRSFPDRGERNAGIKSNEPSFMLNRKSKQVYVGQLPRSMNSGRVHEIRIQQTDFIRPEFMDILLAGLRGRLHGSLYG